MKSTRHKIDKSIQISMTLGAIKIIIDSYVKFC